MRLPLELRLLPAALALAGAVGLFPGAASAAPTPREKAEAKLLVRDARRAMKEERFDDAAVGLRKADQLDPSPAVEVELATALARAGHLLEASGVVKYALDVPALGRRDRDAATRLAADLDGRIPRVQVTVAGPAADKPVTVTLDGKATKTGVDVPTELGSHRLAAESAGYRPAERTVRLAEGARERVELTLVALEEKVTPGSKAPAVVAFGVGAVGLALGTAFGVLALNNASTAKAQCLGNDCTSAAQVPLDHSRRDGTISTVAFVFAGAGVAAGAAFLVLDPFKKKGSDGDEAATKVQAFVGPGRAGLVGRF